MVMAPERAKLTVEPDAVQVFKAALEMRIAFDVIEDVPGLRFGQQIKPLARFGRAHFKRRFAGLAGVLQSGLRGQTQPGVFRHATYRMIEVGESFHRGDARRFQLLHLSAADVGHVEQAVLTLPNTCTIIAPAAQVAVGTGNGPCRRRVGHEPFQPCPRHPGVGRIVGKPQRRAGAVAQFNMGELGRDTLNFGQQVGIEHQLQDVFRMRAALQLGVRHFVAESAKGGGALHAFQKIRPPAPVSRQERPLKHDLRSGSKCSAGCGGVLHQVAPRYLHDTAPCGAQPCQVRRLVGVALLLQQGGILTILARIRPLSPQTG